jgi:hypothetical protein
MPAKFFLSTLLAGLVAANAIPEPAAPSAPATTVMPVYLAVDPQSLVADVITANGDFTSYTFTCAPGVACDFAGRGGNLTVTDASTYIMSVNGAAAGTPADNLHVACTSYNSQSVVCSETQNSVIVGAGGATSLSTSSVVFTQNTFQMIPLTVTAGVELLLSAAAEATTAPNTATLTSTGTAGTASASATKKAAAGMNEVSWLGAGIAAAALVL